MEPAAALLHRRLAERAAGQDAVLSRADVLALGGDDALVRQHRRAGEWVPLLRGTWLTDAWVTGADLQRAWARSAVLSVAGSVVCAGTAAALHRLEGVPPSGCVDVAVDRFLRTRPRALRPHQLALRPGEVVDLAGIPVTGVVRTLADVVPALERADALAVLDSALRRGVATRADLAAAARLAAGRRGGARRRRPVGARRPARGEPAGEPGAPAPARRRPGPRRPAA